MNKNGRCFRPKKNFPVSIFSSVLDWPIVEEISFKNWDHQKRTAPVWNSNMRTQTRTGVCKEWTVWNLKMRTGTVLFFGTAHENGDRKKFFVCFFSSWNKFLKKKTFCLFFWETARNFWRQKKKKIGGKDVHRVSRQETYETTKKTPFCLDYSFLGEERNFTMLRGKKNNNKITNFVQTLKLFFLNYFSLWCNFVMA